MISKNKKVQKFVSALLVVMMLLPSMFVFSLPQKVVAQIPVTDVAALGQRILTHAQKVYSNIKDTFIASSTGTTAATNIKQWAWHIITELAKVAAMKALQEVTKSTVNWINQGYHGSPLFLENPESFFKDIEKFEVRTLVDLYGYDSLRFPYGKDFALNTIYAYKSQLANNSTYSLSQYINDPVLIKNYQNDFSVGGWDGFMLNTMFPQNNYIGFQMLANEELAGRIQGEAGSAKDKVNKLLDRGMGFLSPQICQTNDKYNDLKNEFNAPTWNPAKWETDNPYEPPECDGSDISTTPDPTTGICTAEINYDTLYFQRQEAARATWNDPATGNVCPPRKDGSSGLANTTPGSVVANQIIKSVQSPSTLKEQAINSGSVILSAVFDQLINKFIDKGLNSLTSSINPDEPEDTWSYNGLTLGGSATVGGYGDPWDSGPDEVVVVADFKTKLEQDIEKTAAEIKYMTNGVPDSFGPGTMELLAQIWPKVQTLDICQPGPDLNWQSRLDTEMANSQGKFYEASGDNPPPPDASSNGKELQYAASVFKDWISTQIKYNLPSSPSFVSAINGLSGLGQQAEQVEGRIDEKQDTLAQLKTIKIKLDTLSGEPEAGSQDEDTMLSLWTQYKSMIGQISNDVTLGEARNERDTASAKRDNLDQLITQCGQERTAKGWAVPGGAQSILSSANVSEQGYFCDSPIAGGYSHKTFVNPAATPAYPQIPLVNAQNVGSSSVDVNLNCATIFNANILDYKGDLPSF